MKYKIRDVIVFKADREAIIITNVDPKTKEYTFSFIHLDRIDTGYWVNEDGLERMGGVLVGNDIPFDTIRMLYL